MNRLGAPLPRHRLIAVPPFAIDRFAGYPQPVVDARPARSCGLEGNPSRLEDGRFLVDHVADLRRQFHEREDPERRHYRGAI